MPNNRYYPFIFRDRPILPRKTIFSDPTLFPIFMLDWINPQRRVASMSWTTTETQTTKLTEEVPTELVVLKERIQGQPPRVRAELEPLIDEVLEHAMFRNRVMLIARDALQQFRLDLSSLRFDLEVTRRERRSD